MDGFLLIHKPEQVTSFDCLMLIKKQLDLHTKIGHAGTLDAFASGLLIIALGRTATARIKELMVLDKRYCAIAQFGIETDTLDPTGSQIAHSEYVPQEHELKTVLESFYPSYWQIPPIFSALKHKGERLSDLKRDRFDQQFLERIALSKKNLVDIYKTNIISYQKDAVELQLHVSHGTYVRSFVRDLAYKVGSCAHVRTLVRTRIGPFTLDQAQDPQVLVKETMQNHLISVDDMQAMLKEYTKDQNARKKALQLQEYKQKRSIL